MTQQGKEVLDVAAASTGIMSLAAWLPPTAALFTLVWTGIRIYETDTVQKLVHKRKANELRANQIDPD